MKRGGKERGSEVFLYKEREIVGVNRARTSYVKDHGSESSSFQSCTSHLTHAQRITH